MKRYTILSLVTLFVLGMTINATAMSNTEMETHDKSKAEENMSHDMGKSHEKHGGHEMSSDDFVEIGKDTQKNVVATVKVKTYDVETKAMMAKMGMNATHHVMVFFNDEKTGEPVSGGKAAVKVKGQEFKPSMLMQMAEGYGADVVLEEKMNTFEIGSKLADGQKRQFKVKYHIK